MTNAVIGVGSLRRQRRTAAVMLSGAAGLAAVVLAGGLFGGVRLNTTPSEPLGLWRIAPLERPVAVGDVVFACPPDTAAMREARRLGYLRAGLCAGGFGPLIKMVIAVEGQHTRIGQNVWIDGAPIPHSAIVASDGKGRTLHAHVGGIVPPEAVFLHSGFAGSWDSRYFGPVPASGILGLAREVLTYAP